MKQAHISHYTNGFQRKSEGKETSITFDIIAGTSIGVMNAGNIDKLRY
jgi:patatin-like phospholipase/acyl hydrolase